MKDQIKHIVEDFDFNGVNQTDTAADRFVNSFDKMFKITVDLGLPSGTLWCKYNMGCDYNKLNKYPKSSKAEDWYGDYYKWGATKPITVKNRIQVEPLTIEQIPPYNAEGKLKYDGSKPRYSVLELRDDVAHLTMHCVNLKFFIPETKHFDELLEYTTNKKVQDYHDIVGLNGVEFTSTVNGNKLFIPASGWYSIASSQVNQVGIKFHVWTANLDLTDSSHTGAYSFTNAIGGVQTAAHYITDEIPIRPIAVK